MGRPVYRRSVTQVPGIYFIGLGWLNTWGSGRFLGVDEDARYLAERIVAPAGAIPAFRAAE